MRTVDDAAVQRHLRSSRVGLRARARLAREIVATYVEVRWLMRRRDVGAVVERLRAGAADRYDPDEACRLGMRLARPVRRTLDPLPWDSRCLMRSLVLLRMLARRGVVCELIIGVLVEDGFKAHAWIEHAGRPLLPPLGYQPLTRL